MNNICEYTLKLLRYVINGEDVVLPECEDFWQLFRFAGSHGIENMIYAGLRDLNIKVPDDVMQEFEFSYDDAIMLEAVQALELEAITEEFEKKEIDHIPLKGSVVKYLYPMPDYRKSGDIDILIRNEDVRKINKTMEELGYTEEEEFEEYEVHLVHVKPPYVKVEIHKLLTTPESRTARFCDLAWDNASRAEGHSHLYEFSDEFLYVYLLVHLCKHLNSGGAGIKLITDLWVIFQKKQLDKDKVNKFLKKANLTKLNSYVTKLAYKWFGDGYEEDKDVEVLEKIILNSGSFGTKEIYAAMRQSDTKLGKVKRFIRMLFPRRVSLERKYPILQKSALFLPGVWVLRGIKKAFFERDTVSDLVDDNFADSEKVTGFENIVKAVKDK